MSTSKVSARLTPADREAVMQAISTGMRVLRMRGCPPHTPTVT